MPTANHLLCGLFICQGPHRTPTGSSLWGKCTPSLGALLPQMSPTHHPGGADVLPLPSTSQVPLLKPPLSRVEPALPLQGSWNVSPREECANH